MQLEHAFTVEAPVDTVYAALLDPQRVAPCMPGATLLSVDGTTFTGKVKVKLGPVSLQYKGTGEYTDTDEAARTVVIEASGKDAKGNGTAAATVTLTLTDDGARTAGTSSTELTVTGKPAQFGRGMISDVGGKILEQFAANLSAELGGAGTAAQTSADAAARDAAAADATTTADTAQGSSAGAQDPAAAGPSAGAPDRGPQPVREAEPLDLGEYAGGAVIKRALPLVGLGGLAALVLILILRRRADGAPREDDR